MVFLAEEHIPIPTKDILSWIFDDVPYAPDKPVYIDTARPERSISNKQARSIIRKLIAGFKKWGLRPGMKDVVCLHSFNDIMYTMIFLGTIGAGGIFAATNPSYTPYELVHHIKTADVKYLITEPEMLQPILEAARECKIPDLNVLIFDVHGQAIPEGFRSWETLLNHGEEDWVRFDDLQTAETTEAARLFSSGTTGLPKATMTTHYNLVAEHTLLWDRDARDYDQKRLLCLPMFHAAAFPTAHTTCLKTGDDSYVMRRFDLEAFLANIENYQITDIGVVPPLVIAIIMSDLCKKYSLKSLRSAACGAAPLGKEPQKRLQDLMAEGAPFTQVWGMTETTCIATHFHWPEQDDTGSVGRPLANIDMKIIDDAGNDITAYDTRGELCVRGPIIIPGYYANPTADAAFDADGFYHTGDIVYCASRTKLWYIVDRKKELIKVRAFQVAPPELEAVLISHPQIVDVGVIGVPDGQGNEDGGQLPRAYVVKRPGEEGDRLTEEEVKGYLAAKLTRIKRLEGGVVFVDTIPRNASGKILKRVLREWAKKEMSAKL